MTSNHDQHNITAYIDHTYLKPEAEAKDIERICGEAAEYGFYSVCVNSMWVPNCRELLAGTNVKISAVCGFPLGANAPEVKAYEAAYCVEKGAAEIDMVMAIGAMIAGDDGRVFDDIRKVTSIVSDSAIVKVILETGLLTQEQIIRASQISEEAGAHFVKTSTGFGPRGASLDDIAWMKSAISSSVRIKASGGIRDYASAVLMLEAGAHRLGTSAGVAIAEGRVSEASRNDY